MENRYIINFDLKTKNAFNIRFSQGDTDASILEVNLTDDGVMVDMTGETIEFRFKKPDNNKVFQDITTGVSIVDPLKGKTECILKSDTLSYPGVVLCEIFRSKDTKRLTTTKFSFTVGSTIGEGELSVNYISSIENKLVEWQSEFGASETTRTNTFTTNETARDTEFNIIKGVYDIASHDNVNIELVNARKGEVDLGTKIGKLDSSLANNVTQLNSMKVNVMTPPLPFTPPKGDGIQDDTSFIQNIINLGFDVDIPKGTYLIKHQLVINKVGQIIRGKNYFDTILKASDDFTDESVLYLDGSISPAYRSNQKLLNICINGNLKTNAIKINKNADFIIDSCRFYNSLTAMYFIDTLLYVISNCRIDDNNIAIYFYGSNTLSANNNVKFFNNKIIGNKIVILQRTSTNVGGNIIFDNCEIEQNGVVGSTDPVIYMEGSNLTQNMVTFRDCWIEGNHSKTIISLKMGLQNTALFENCRMLTTALEADYMIYAIPLDGTYNGSGCSIEISNCYDASQYNINTLKTTGLITVQALNYFYSSIGIENIDLSYIKQAGINKFVSNMNFNNGKGINMYSPSGTGYNKVYSKSANALNFESEKGFIDISSASGLYWGSATANSYLKPFRIGGLWLWQNSTSLYMKYGGSYPISATDGTIIGTAT